MPGLFGSLLVGVTGLMGNSTRMGTISDNIANVSTVGYKRVDTQFQTLVTERIQSTSYSPGGVLSRPRQLVDVQGIITSTTNSTDIAISGNGLFVVGDETEASLDADLVYTRSGSFRPDQDGFLQNTAGYYLKGWAVNSEGEVIDPSSDATIPSPGKTDLITVSLTDQEDTGVDIEQSVRATTEVTTRANLPAEAEQQALGLSLFDDSNNLLGTLVGSEGVTINNPITIQLADGTGSTISLNVTLDDADLNTVTTGENFQITDSGGTVFDLPGLSGFSGSITEFAAAMAADADAIAAGFSVTDNADGTITINASGAGTAAAGAVTASTETVAPSILGLNNAINALANQVSGSRTFNLNSSFTGGQITLSAQEVLDSGSSVDKQIVGLTGVVVDTPPQDVTAATLTVTLQDTGGVIDLSGEASLEGLTQDTEAFISAVNALGTVTDDMGDSYTLTASANADGEVAITANRTDDAGSGGGTGAVQSLTTGLTYADAATLRAGADTGAFGEDFSSATTYSQTVQVFDSLGSSHNVTYNWVRRKDEPNLWEVRITEADVTGLNTEDESSVGAEFDASDPTAGGVRFAVALEGNTEAAEFTQRLFVKFNGDGSLEEVRVTRDGAAGTTLEGNTVTTGLATNRETDDSEVAKVIAVAIGPLDSDNFTTGRSDGAPFGSGDIDTNPPFAPTTDDTDEPESANAIAYEWNIGNPALEDQGGGTGLDGLTQFDSGETTPIIETFYVDQNGARVGNLIGVEVDTDGLVYGIYDNGISQPIWQIAVGTFANPNGLINRSGNVYAEGPDSGTVQIKFPGSTGAGTIIGGAVEQSNVDLGDEFTNMIITQQAFTANTRTVTTSDRMLEELVRILR